MERVKEEMLECCKKKRELAHIVRLLPPWSLPDVVIIYLTSIGRYWRRIPDSAAILAGGQ